MSFVIKASAERPGDDESFKALLVSQCQQLTKCWQHFYATRLAELPAAHLTTLRIAASALPDYRMHLNYLNARVRDNDGVNPDDNSILFIRLNRGGKELGGEELIFSLFKSAFPAAKDAVENAASGFLAPSRLFSLLVRLVASDGDPANLANGISLQSFKTKIKDLEFKGQLDDFIHNRVAKIMDKARDLLTGPHVYSLPSALATRTIRNAPNAFLAMLYWLNKGGGVDANSSEHRSLLAVFTVVSWFSPGNNNQQGENLATWMKATKSSPLDEFWSPKHIWPLFIQSEDPIPIFPDPVQLKDFLEQTVVNDANYNWETLGATCPYHAVFDGYTRLPNPEIMPVAKHPDEQTSTPRQLVLQANLREFVGMLSSNYNMLLFAQREFITRAFGEFQQWDVVLDDTNAPWDWDHIYPSASGRHNVYPTYRAWHDKIGNKRVEELSSNRSNGDSAPKVKLADEKTRKDSFISEEIWGLIQQVSPSIKDEANARLLCRINVRRMAEIYAEWHNVLHIGDLVKP